MAGFVVSLWPRSSHPGKLFFFPSVRRAPLWPVSPGLSRHFFGLGDRFEGHGSWARRVCGVTNHPLSLIFEWPRSCLPPSPPPPPPARVVDLLIHVCRCFPAVSRLVCLPSVSHTSRCNVPARSLNQARGGCMRGLPPTDPALSGAVWIKTFKFDYVMDAKSSSPPTGGFFTSGKWRDCITSAMHVSQVGHDGSLRCRLLDKDWRLKRFSNNLWTSKLEYWEWHELPLLVDNFHQLLEKFRSKLKM